MIVRNNIPIYKICWLNHAEGGIIGSFYEPETKEELVELCCTLYKEKRTFDLIGHTSNIYFLPNYSVDIMVSTRKVNNVDYLADCIVADCGASVRLLAHKMVEEGVVGFEGLIDLPGTVAASVYGNASCYGCSINSLLLSLELLRPTGEIVKIKPKDLKLSRRSSALKRGELTGVILSITLKKQIGNVIEIKQKAEYNHQHRKATQPPSNDNLGSIYKTSTGWSYASIFPRMLSNIYCFLLLIWEKDRTKLKRRKTEFILKMLGAKDLVPYVYGWNRYIWKDEKAHVLFWKYHRIHQTMFKQSNFEIEIKGKR